MKRKLILKKQVLISLMLLFISLIIFSGFKIITWYLDSKDVQKSLENITEKTKVEEVEDNENTIVVGENIDIPKENPYWDYIKMKLINVDFKALKQTNPDIVGWLEVKGTNINYPFVQTSNNTYYLERNIKKEHNSAGWVFLDYRNNIQDFDKNTILYAHGRVDGTMFGSLKNIFKTSWPQNISNHVIKLSTEYENTLWQVFSIYEIPTTSDYLTTEFKSNSEFLSFITMLQKRSTYQFAAVLNENDKILTLSTCSANNGRVVLHAKLIKKEIRNGNN